MYSKTDIYFTTISSETGTKKLATVGYTLIIVTEVHFSLIITKSIEETKLIDEYKMEGLA
jgi:hypothetical protein